MSMPVEESPKAMPVAGRKMLRVSGQLLMVLAGLAALLFLPAGRLAWIEAWAFIIAYGIFLALYALWGLIKDPGQLAERSYARKAKNVKGWDRVIISLYTVFLLATFVVCGLDAGRFRWSAVPPLAEGLGWSGLALAGALIFWTLATNTYLSRMARIQDDREQVVITSGPYRFVRHPMYLGIIVLFACTPLALGSLWGLVPGGIICILFVVRTAKEDRMLREELAGYKEYTQRVRYRLIPRIW
jgi:protein-S-isoprenylcysteine O-methyltransferase Ste14